jgi:hypothetical protein
MVLKQPTHKNFIGIGVLAIGMGGLVLVGGGAGIGALTSKNRMAGAKKGAVIGGALMLLDFIAFDFAISERLGAGYGAIGKVKKDDE